LIQDGNGNYRRGVEEYEDFYAEEIEQAEEAEEVGVWREEGGPDSGVEEEDEEEEEYQQEEEDGSAFGLLPEQVLIHLVGFLDGRAILRLQCVSRRFRRVGSDPRVWARLCLRDFKMRYLTSQVLWINYTRGYSSPSSSSAVAGTLPFFPFPQTGPKPTFAVRTRPQVNYC
jgi:hypothetical protein